ncbi:MAG: HD domain-containing protein [Evtepia sp.]
MNIDIPSAVSGILSTIEQHGFEAYTVGGCVRDTLYGIVPHDWDICTNAAPEQVKACFPADTKIIETGIRHGTITIRMDHQSYEVTTFRVDGAYSDHRHPKEVKFVHSLKEDLSRRDFTVNAMAYHPQKGLIDHFNGYEDLKRKCIRCVGDPNLRFQEDALRIMRALRFAATYDFTIAHDTQQALYQNKNLLCTISVERLNIEFCKLLCGIAAASILNEYAAVFCTFIPELKPMIGLERPYHNLDVWQHTIKSVANTPSDLILRLTMLFHDIAKPDAYRQDETHIGHFYDHAQKSAAMSESILTRLRFDKETISEVKELILYHGIPLESESKSLKHWLNKIGASRLRKLIEIQRADTLGISHQAERLKQLDTISLAIDEIIQQKQCFSLKNLAINGSDLIQIGMQEGTQIGATLHHLMNLVIEEKLPNERHALLNAIMNWK